MAFQVFLKTKASKSVMANLSIRRSPTPKVGDIIDCPIGDPADRLTVRAKVIAIRTGTLSALPGETLDLVDAMEI